MKTFIAQSISNGWHCLALRSPKMRVFNRTVVWTYFTKCTCQYQCIVSPVQSWQPWIFRCHGVPIKLYTLYACITIFIRHYHPPACFELQVIMHSHSIGGPQSKHKVTARLIRDMILTDKILWPVRCYFLSRDKTYTYVFGYLLTHAPLSD